MENEKVEGEEEGHKLDGDTSKTIALSELPFSHLVWLP